MSGFAALFLFRLPARPKHLHYFNKYTPVRWLRAYAKPHTIGTQPAHFALHPGKPYAPGAGLANVQSI